MLIHAAVAVKVAKKKEMQHPHHTTRWKMSEKSVCTPSLAQMWFASILPFHYLPFDGARIYLPRSKFAFENSNFILIMPILFGLEVHAWEVIS